ncbi:flavin reductase (DIM6/NTAB) family NADH-FMN oxidoreductase RutF [Hephaestia caeni]|uniref:Flavin reductase (DIM6/NTAB) family NADH-FMN oxidoreductase RutF n=2 Tax=Hephaestia caeni TaxID=645617 RepID=A0A397NUL1_9SPHN|nr:flavin reductase (DIM6/NTAB) family NADH-FMN oxidoreductase RutF [Hephaestia caeni]
MPTGNFRFIDPEVQDDFKRGIFNAIIAPRPIAWISTLDANGHANLAPFSYFALFSSLPPIIAFSCNTPEDRQAKDTLANIRETGEFVYNMATYDLVEAMNATSAPLAAGADEFLLAGIEKVPSIKVRPPRVAGTPASLECVVDRIVQLGEREGEIPTHVTFGRVVGIHLDEDYLDESGYFLTEKANPVARLGGIQYAVSAPPFELPRQFTRAREDSY